MKNLNIKVFLNNWIKISCYHFQAFKCPSMTMAWDGNGQEVLVSDFCYFFLISCFHDHHNMKNWKEIMLGSSSPCHLLMSLFTSIFRPWSCGQHQRNYNNTMYYKSIKGSPFSFVFFCVQTKLRGIRPQVDTF